MSKATEPTQSDATLEELKKRRQELIESMPIAKKPDESLHAYEGRLKEGVEDAWKQFGMTREGAVQTAGYHLLEEERLNTLHRKRVTMQEPQENQGPLKDIELHVQNLKIAKSNYVKGLYQSVADGDFENAALLAQKKISENAAYMQKFKEQAEKHQKAAEKWRKDNNEKKLSYRDQLNNNDYKCYKSDMDIYNALEATNEYLAEKESALAKMASYTKAQQKLKEIDGIDQQISKIKGRTLFGKKVNEEHFNTRTKADRSKSVTEQKPVEVLPLEEGWHPLIYTQEERVEGQKKQAMELKEIQQERQGKVRKENPPSSERKPSVQKSNKPSFLKELGKFFKHTETRKGSHGALTSPSHMTPSGKLKKDTGLSS